MMFNVTLVTTSSMWSLEIFFGHIQIYAAFYVQATTVELFHISTVRNDAIGTILHLLLLNFQLVLISTQVLN
jgi:hypothetical protein